MLRSQVRLMSGTTYPVAYMSVVRLAILVVVGELLPKVSGRMFTCPWVSRPAGVAIQQERQRYRRWCAGVMWYVVVGQGGKRGAVSATCSSVRCSVPKWQAGVAVAGVTLEVTNRGDTTECPTALL